MDLRVRNLSTVDPLAVPLPSGTEVTTRVDRLLPTDPTAPSTRSERRVPEGSIGRVVAIVGDELDVKIVGVGVVRYSRSELVPRKIGQTRFALRRAFAWNALRPCTVLEATVGSRAWGLSDENSDTDRRGIFVLPFPWTTGLADPPQDLVSTDGSETYWEVGKAIRQALRADPNTLELLFVASARATDPIGEWILEERDAFVSAEIYGSFGRYALSQLKRLVQSQRLAEHRGILLDWLAEDPSLSLDDAAARLAEHNPGVAKAQADRLLLAKEYIKQLYRSLYDQGLLPNRDYPSLVRFASESQIAMELPRELRPKNAYNLVRLIGTAATWLREGHVNLEVVGPFRDLLLGIKKGQLSLDETLAEAEERAQDLEAAWRATVLPKHPDVARADVLLRRIGAEAAKRSVLGEPGPLGRDAPERPAVELDQGEEG